MFKLVGSIAMSFMLHLNYPSPYKAIDMLLNCFIW